MPLSTLKVVIDDLVSPLPRSYDVTLELGGGITTKSFFIPAEGSGSVEFPIDAPGSGRLTIEKPSDLDATQLSGVQLSDVVLEDVYEYNINVVLVDSMLRVVPVGFSDTSSQMIDEATLTFDRVASQSVFRLEVPLIAEFFTRPVPARRRGGSAPVGPKEGLPPEVETFRPRAHFFPGSDPSKRALVIAGVHGSEPQAVRAAELILAALQSGRRPQFSTVVLTEVIPRTQPPGEQHDGKEKDRNVLVGKKSVEPNRTFPLPGTSYASARELGRVRPDRAELLYKITDPKSKKVGQLAVSDYPRLLPETRLLLALIERFKPDRIVSLHAHRSVPERGNSAGIFVDPRGGVFVRGGRNPAPLPTDVVADPERHQILLAPALGKPDIDLVKQMVCAFEARHLDEKLRTANDPLRGNRISLDRKKLTKSINGITTIYAASHPNGNSLGDWAPVAVQETVAGVHAPRGNRPGIITITVELPREEGTTTMKVLEQMHADVILDIFLGTEPPPPAAETVGGATKAPPKKKTEFVPDVITDCPAP